MHAHGMTIGCDVVVSGLRGNDCIGLIVGFVVDFVVGFVVDDVLSMVVRWGREKLMARGC